MISQPPTFSVESLNCEGFLHPTPAFCIPFKVADRDDSPLDKVARTMRLHVTCQDLTQLLHRADLTDIPVWRV